MPCSPANHSEWEIALVAKVENRTFNVGIDNNDPIPTPAGKQVRNRFDKLSSRE